MKTLLNLGAIAALAFALTSCCCDRDNCCCDPCPPKPRCCEPRPCCPKPFCPPQGQQYFDNNNQCCY